MSTIDEIKTRIDIVDLVSETVQLRHSGKNYIGFCPFHPNTRTPAFVVFPETGTWRCFGQCNEGGDIFKFLMKKENIDFSEALRQLAERAGVQLRPPTPQEQAAADEHDALRMMLEEAVTFFRHQLLNTSAGQEALEYLRTKRNFSYETIEAFGLGYAPNSWEAALTFFKAKNYGEEQLLAGGLISERETGGYYDRFRHRIMIPIRDARGRIAGFGARILNPDDLPKFLNSPQTVIFDKSRLLYGLDRASQAIRMEDQAVIVEGYFDVIALHQAGYANVVSPMGTALTEPQLYILKRYSRRIILALDSDAAGDQATLRGLEIARQSLDREQDPVFDSRGLIRHEARLKADIRVTTLPDGLDPDEVVLRNPQDWVTSIEEARPIVIHVMETLARDRDLENPKTKTEIANQVLPLIEDVPEPIERDTYRQRLARMLHVDERSLLNRARTKASRRKRIPLRDQDTPPEKTSPVRYSGGYSLEVHCLGVLLRQPSLLFQVDRRLLESGLPRLSPQDFQHVDHQAIFRLFQESIGQDYAEPLNYVFNSLSLPMMEIAEELLAQTSDLDPNEDRVLEDLMRGLLELRLRNLHQNIEYLRFLMEEAQEQGDVQARDYLATMVQHTETLRLLNLAIGRYTSRSIPTR